MTHQTHRGRATPVEGKVAVQDKGTQGTAVAAHQPNHRLLILAAAAVDTVTRAVTYVRCDHSSAVSVCAALAL